LKSRGSAFNFVVGLTGKVDGGIGSEVADKREMMSARLDVVMAATAASREAAFWAANSFETEKSPAEIRPGRADACSAREELIELIDV
jgi:hypothetical protein